MQHLDRRFSSHACTRAASDIQLTIDFDLINPEDGPSVPAQPPRSLGLTTHNQANSKARAHPTCTSVPQHAPPWGPSRGYPGLRQVLSIRSPLTINPSKTSPPFLTKPVATEGSAPHGHQQHEFPPFQIKTLGELTITQQQQYPTCSPITTGFFKNSVTNGYCGIHREIITTDALNFLVETAFTQVTGNHLLGYSKCLGCMS